MALLKRRTGRLVCLLTLLIGFPSLLPKAQGADTSVIAVISSNSGPYLQALQGFKEAFGRAVPVYALSEGEPRFYPDTRVIVAFGGKAALFDNYPAQAAFIYALSPGTRAIAEKHLAGLQKVHTSPPIYGAVSQFKEIQPALKRLAVIGSESSLETIAESQKDVSERLSVELITIRLQSPDELPERLRTLLGRADAIWLPADALTVTPQNFATIKEFSLANGMPFYVPSDGLAEQGAAAAVFFSFKDIGALTGRLALQALAGRVENASLYPDKIHYAINLTSARRSHLTLDDKVLKQADKIIP